MIRNVKLLIMLYNIPMHVTSRMRITTRTTSQVGLAQVNHLIAAIKEHIERSHTGSQNACMLVAPTGAAFNIGGLTIQASSRTR